MNIALVPGVIGFDRFGPLHYFNGVAQHLETVFQEATVRELTTDPVGTVADRAEVLAREIGSAFGGAEPVHLIAHSMGGLDARYLVCHDIQGQGRRVKTVVSISTPHRGSPVADALDRVNPLNLLPGLDLAAPFFAELRAKTNALHALSAAGVTQVLGSCADVPGVSYFDIASAGRNALPPTSVFFAAPYAWCRLRAGANDGVVPMSSAIRQPQAFAIWTGDHADLIGHDLDHPLGVPAFDYLRAYEDIVRRGILTTP
jgi:triacylglycerol lipase